MCLGQKILQLITWNKTELNWYVYDFSVDYNIDVNDIVDIHKYKLKTWF